MSKPSRCIFAIPTPSIDEVPKGFGSRLSQDYLNAWTALWDPRLIVAFNGVPEWRRGDTSGLDIEGSLIVCPDLLKTTIDIPLEERVRANQNKLLYSNCRSRAEVVSDVLEAIEQPSNTSPALLEDFYALGFVVFHVQVIAR